MRYFITGRLVLYSQIEAGQRQQAQSMGYTVVDPSTVVATHLNKLMAEQAEDLFGHAEAQELLDRLATSAPRLVEDLIPKVLPMHLLVRVLQNLLRDGVSVKDIRTIVENLAEHAATTQDPWILTAKTRVALGRLIYQQVCGQADEIGIITLDPGLEQLLRQASSIGGDATAALEPGLAQRFQQALLEAKQQRDMAGEAPILLVPEQLWPAVSNFVRRAAQGMHVLSFEELPDDKRIRVVASVGG